MTNKKTPDTDPQIPAVKHSQEQENILTETHPELAIPEFADKVKDLMNYAYQQSQPSEGQAPTEHHQKFADWCNALGDLWREVKSHA